MTVSTVKTDKASAAVPPVARPTAPAHIIKDDAEAIAIAHALAAEFVKDSSQRDRERIWPVAELDAFSQSGLWSINVPKAFGGPEVSYATLAKVIEIISAADSSIGQVAQNHLGVVAAIRTVSDADQQKLLFAEALKGTRFGNAFSEFGSKRAADFETRFTDAGDHVVVNGRKFYSSGALLAHLVPIVALDDEGRAWYAIADRAAPGLTVIDDWSSFGQRTTLSGTVIIDNVKVPKTHLVPGYKGYDRPTADGAIFQIIQVAVDTGIAQAAIDETVNFVRTKSRAWIDSGVDNAWDDPYTIQAIGDLTLRLHAAQALLEKAGHAIDRAVIDPTAETVAHAQIVTAEAKILSTEIAIAATNRLFELAGTRSTLAEYNLDRHWRNARTHTLHDPVRWKYSILGEYFLNGENPPLHAWS
ncbi:MULTISPECIES: SfnB family sulfur acquisition oxidoreductase [unclassified Mesorhizobium]|uniref:SfnB family sulfur acquisition oxidoreductase n=1 Tax=unclassified Mesorhizobium TaxID=325217 RepID=UPI000FCA0D4B|nr:MULTISPECIES: SfnB family sulfur acquisition oxidoreductase [unclassified Mesorhizobium]RUU59057.1 SfnB family sulfur acquisition oxidoreductase [Mesorhizobium sp. M7A.T.Ca.TU.009.01.1.1]RUU88668.1 SfnB family sulfur acquisition oxidoreductase [Mesorhizobium sp. M7A.T.Ca.TU.009.01.1.2]RUT90056.1 SfnB family sulfur acquisition oxidoreductase [Mesorhizobium sp. M7A.T.Ca.US.000.02.1.1]RUT92824.1 SfnB family sulfur acquisition oxidoreductase [Mesorhizobium sp. M7A.T.Ca.US.000.02.2.1]RUT98015.1 